MGIKKSKIINSLRSKFARSIMMPLISIFVVVLAAIIFIVFTSFTSEMKDSAIDNKMQQIRNTEQSITERISEVNSISYYISNNSLFNFIPIKKDKSTGYEMSMVLQQLLVGNRFVSYLSFYRTSEQDKIYTSKGEMLFHTFWNSYIALEGVTEEQFLYQIRSQSNRKVLPIRESEHGNSYMTLIYPIPLSVSNPKAFVVSYVDGSQIDTITSSIFDDCQGELLIYDLDALIYNYVSPGRESLQEEIKDKAANLTKEMPYSEVTIEDQSYILLKHQSDNNGWSYVSLIRKNDITGHLTDKQISFLLILVTIILLAIVAIMTLVLFNYRFVNKLAQTVSSVFNITDGEENNEQLLLSNAYLALLEKTQTATQNLFLTNLIAGQYDETTIESAVNEYNIAFEYPNYLACVVYFHGSQATQISDALMAFIKEHFDRDNMLCYPIWQTSPNRILIIVNAADDVLEWEAFESVLSYLYYGLAGEFNQTISIGVGRKYSTLYKVYDSAYEAVTAMYFCILEGKRYIKRYTDIDMETITKNMSHIIERIITIVRQGNTDEIPKAMKELHSLNTAHGFSVQYQNFIAYSLITALKEYVDDPSIYDKMNTILMDLINRTHEKKLNVFDEIEHLCVLIAERRNEIRNSNKNSDLVDMIITVITENLFDSMMSLESISEKCGISPSYLSRIFKAKMGDTPMSYVEKLRMSKVKEKLRNTDESLKQILIDTGYIDQSNFIRKFKKLEGVTPITYRKMHQSNKED